MRTTLAALAGASAAFASVTPDSDWSPPAYGGNDGPKSEYAPSSYAADTTSSYAHEATSSYAADKTSSYASGTSSSVADSASGTPDFPSCWASCFKEAGISSKEETCGNDEVSDCIEESCSDDEAEDYSSWLAKECGGASTSSKVVGPTGSMSLSHGPSGYASSSSLTGYPHGSASSGYPSGPASSGPSGYVPSSSGYPGGYGNCSTTYSSVCTETETKIYRSTTEYVPTTITHIFTTNLPSGSCSSVPYPITSSSSVPYSPETTSKVPGGYPGDDTSIPAYPGKDTSSTPVYPADESSSSPVSPGQPSDYPEGGNGGDGGYDTTTEIKTVYTTVCPATKTTESEGQTITSVYETTSEVTEVITSTIHVPGSQTSPASPATTTPAGGAPSDTPSCWNSCFSQNGVTSQDAACDNDAVSQCIKESCSAEESTAYDAWVADYCGGDDGELPTEPAGGNNGGNQGTPTEYTSVKPVSKPFTYGDWTSYYTDFETMTLTSYLTETVPASQPTGGYGSPDGPTEGSPEGPATTPAPTGGYGGHETTQTQTYEIPITTDYTTVCPNESKTDEITTSTITTTSTSTLTFTVTTTDYPEQTSSSTKDGELPPYPTGSASESHSGVYPTGSYPIGSGSVSSSKTSSTPAGPTSSGPAQPPIPSCWAKCFAEYEVTSEADLCGDIDVETCIKAECPTDSYDAYEGWLDDYCGSASTSSGVVGPTGTSSGYPQPTGTGAPHPTGSGNPHPTGTSGPTGTAGPTGTESETCSLPTPTKACKRCEGQPGTDKYCGLDINTNYYKEGNAPITCETVEYEWDISTGTVSPDGVERWAILVNGQSPGPKIEANWGDEIIVHVKNSMPETDLNGTTIHWHGIHQKGTPEYDGVPSLTQCPIAPGDSFTYKFRATQYGSSWYHSHFALQAYDGLFGPMIIHGPVQEGYEYDGEEFIALQDWAHWPLNYKYHELELVSNNQRSAPQLDNGLINGKNTWEGAGERWQMTVTKGKTYRLRVLNAAIQSTFKFYIDGHKFQVIASDFVPIEPYETDMITINNGQRYDVIFTADQPSGNYWMRSDNQATCAPITNGNDIKAIVHYDDADDSEPTSTGPQYQPACEDEKPENLVPIVQWNAGQSSDEISKNVVIQPNGGTPNLFKWTLSGTAFFSQWGDPTLQSIYEDGTVPTYSGNLAIREDNLGEWIYVIIESPIPLPHPIHLHGHDFMVLGQGLGPYAASGATLNLQNPPRRDTAIMPHQVGQAGAQGGWLAVAFYTDNPGVWLMHCHIGFVSPPPSPLISRRTVFR